MRDIIFRGRQKGGTEWFYGDLSYLVHDKQKCYIFPADGYNSPDWYEADSDTVGQYTGLTDRKGAKIFEGDIVRLVYDGVQNVFVVIFDDEELDFKATKDGKQDYGRGEFQYMPCCDEVEVIGNRWDNPELLEATP